MSDTPELYPMCIQCGTTVDDVNNVLCYDCEFGE